MVALKPGSAQSRASPAGKKQERRGGIETLNCLLTPPALERGSRNAVVALKPGQGGGEARLPNPEAGTPWWH